MPTSTSLHAFLFVLILANFILKCLRTSPVNQCLTAPRVPRRSACAFRTSRKARAASPRAAPKLAPLGPRRQERSSPRRALWAAARFALRRRRRRRPLRRVFDHRYPSQRRPRSRPRLLLRRRCIRSREACWAAPGRLTRPVSVSTWTGGARYLYGHLVWQRPLPSRRQPSPRCTAPRLRVGPQTRRAGVSRRRRRKRRDRSIPQTQGPSLAPRPWRAVQPSPRWTSTVVRTRSGRAPRRSMFVQRFHEATRSWRPPVGLRRAPYPRGARVRRA
mmetsp:Transcript_5568/g.18363  ORF Transcript_5568/g.18363 Transcript_5568/m.18363 type:complete len:274 (+) Transcript_5568:274-1095(+)